MLTNASLRHAYRDIARAVVRRIPVLFTLQATLLATAALAAVIVDFAGTRAPMHTVAFAKPALESGQPWTQQVELYADRVSDAFGISERRAGEFAGWILEASTRQDLDADLLASLVLTESSFRKDVRSSVGAFGPAQVRIEYWENFCGSDDLTDPAENIYCGAQILAYLADRCGDVDCALHAYNVGPHNRDPYRERAGARYVAKVERFWDQLGSSSL